jgi:hypothetical protein
MRYHSDLYQNYKRLKPFFGIGAVSDVTTPAFQLSHEYFLSLWECHTLATSHIAALRPSLLCFDDRLHTCYAVLSKHMTQDAVSLIPGKVQVR